jgi:adenylate cyclase
LLHFTWNLADALQPASVTVVPKMSSCFRFGSYILDLDRACLRGPSGQAELRNKSFEVLRFLVEHGGRVVTKDELIGAVWLNVPTGDDALAKCISEVRRALGDDAKSIIKTVPRRGYLMDVPVSAGEATIGIEAVKTMQPVRGHGRALIPPDDRPSIAILAFANLSGDPHQEYISDGITEDIIVETSRFSGLTVIARNSTFQYKGKSIDVRQVGRELDVRYVLEGSVQKADDRVRISAQLIDAMTGAHRWAERYDRHLEGVFEIQDEVARAIAATIAAHVNNAEMDRSLGKPPATWEAYDYYMRAASELTQLLSSFDARKLLQVRHLLDQSIALAPDYGRAYGLLSHTYVIAWTQPIDDDYLNPAALARAHSLALEGLRLAPRIPEVHTHLGSVLTWKRQHDAARDEFEKAVELNPNFSDWRLASALTYCGELEKAIETIGSHMRLDPFCPPWAHYWSGLSLYLLEQYQAGLAALGNCAARMPNFRSAHSAQAAAFAQLGRLEEARSEAAEVLRIDPKYAISRDERPRVPFRFAKHAEHLFDGFRKAGLPET